MNATQRYHYLKIINIVGSAFLFQFKASLDRFRSMKILNFYFLSFTGVFWPLEGMPLYLQYISYLLPFTLPSIAVRDILTKGWSIAHGSVIAGYGVTISWIIVLLILCLIGLKVKKWWHTREKNSIKFLKLFYRFFCVNSFFFLSPRIVQNFIIFSMN